jgi:hypothetical protein
MKLKGVIQTGNTHGLRSKDLGLPHEETSVQVFDQVVNRTNQSLQQTPGPQDRFTDRWLE